MQSAKGEFHPPLDARMKVTTTYVDRGGAEHAHADEYHLEDGQSEGGIQSKTPVRAGRQTSPLEERKLKTDVAVERERQLGRGAMEWEEPLLAPAVTPPRFSFDWETVKRDETKLATTALVLFLTLVGLFFVTRVAFRRRKPRTVLLVGLNGAGKTALFFQLKDGTTHQGAVTSMEPNDDTFVLHSETTKKGKIKPVHIVDVPGHPKLRPHLEELLPKSSCLVFVVDALDFMPHVRAAAEYLYDILTNKEVVRRKIPLLLTCNKMDKVTAHSSNFIKGQLEKELNKLRKSRSAISSADVSSEIYLGVGEEVFNFTQCSNKITIAEVSALTGKVEQVEQFIREHVKQ